MICDKCKNQSPDGYCAEQGWFCPGSECRELENCDDFEENNKDGLEENK